MLERAGGLLWQQRGGADNGACVYIAAVVLAMVWVLAVLAIRFVRRCRVRGRTACNRHLVLEDRGEGGARCVTNRDQAANGPRSSLEAVVVAGSADVWPRHRTQPVRSKKPVAQLKN